jgi:hypothetical protein
VIEVILHIENGHVTNPKAIRKALEEAGSGTFLVQFRPRKQRSLNQNAYFHAVMVPMVLEGLREVGYSEVKTLEDAKDILKTLFLKKTIRNERSGEEIPVIRNTSELSTSEFNVFMEEVARWASEYLGVFIPPPNYQTQLTYE